MDKKLAQALNDQIKNEFYSAYLYLSMAAHFEGKSLPGFSHWMKVQAKEEWGHGMKIFGFLADRGVKVELQEIQKPPVDFGTAASIFEKVLEHEKKVTSLIDGLYNLSSKVSDNAAVVFLQWFVNEQVEEEKNAVLILDTLKAIKDVGPALIMLDRELAKRE